MVCLTKKLPAVEGTPCGKGRICLQGKCVDKTRKRHYSVRAPDSNAFYSVKHGPIFSQCHEFLCGNRKMSRKEQGGKEKQTLWWKENVSEILLAFPPPPPISSFEIESHMNAVEGSSSYWQAVRSGEEGVFSLVYMSHDV